MTRCIVHFGMFKTGSTSIQHTLFKAPAHPSFRYVHAGQANSSLILRTAFALESSRAMTSLRAQLSVEELQVESARVREALSRQLGSTADNLVLSGEGILNLAEEELEGLHEFLTDRVPKAVAVGYARPIRETIESMFQQRLKQPMPARGDFTHLMPKYSFVLPRFDRVFGAEQVQVWKFDPARFPDGDVVKDFCGRLGIDVPPGQAIRKNESLSRDAVSLLYHYRTASLCADNDSQARRADQLLITALSDLKGPKLRLGRRILEDLFARNRHHLDWIEARVGEEMTALGEERDDDVQSTADVLNTSAEGLQWLGQQALSIGLPIEHPTHAQVPEIMNALRRYFQRSLAQSPTRPGAQATARPRPGRRARAQP